MKKKKTNLLVPVAATLALVVSTYVLGAAHACHDPGTIESCRDAVELIYQTPPDNTVTIQGEDCTLASVSADELVGYDHSSASAVFS